MTGSSSGVSFPLAQLRMPGHREKSSPRPISTQHAFLRFRRVLNDSSRENLYLFDLFPRRRACSFTVCLHSFVFRWMITKTFLRPLSTNLLAQLFRLARSKPNQVSDVHSNSQSDVDGVLFLCVLLPRNGVDIVKNYCFHSGIRSWYPRIGIREHATTFRHGCMQYPERDQEFNIQTHLGPAWA